VKTKIVKNESRKTVTVIISPVAISYVDYLYEKYNNERYFCSAVLQDAKYKEDIVPFLRELVKKLNETAKGVFPEGEEIKMADLITDKEDEFRLFSKNIVKDKDWDGSFKLNLSSKATEKRFLFEDLEQTKPIPKGDGWKHFYAVELEISVGYNEDSLEKYVYTVFHRAISAGKRQANNYVQNDSAWGGFDFKTEKEEKPANKDTESDDDLPF
jgi:hypothetical protein